MNVYEKLQVARIKLQQMNIKPTGKSKFYGYFDLGDFLPQINSICAEVGLCGVISFDEVATLCMVNTEKPEEKIFFASPMSTAELPNCHPVQNLGAVQSYLRRYLWMTCFEIVEHDAIDSTTKADKTAPAFTPDKAMLKRLDDAKSFETDLSPWFKSLSQEDKTNYKPYFTAARTRIEGAANA